jgi:hypothetical protein
MILGSPKDDYTKRQHKVCLWEVCAAKSSVPKFLRWSSTSITIDRGDHPPNVPRPGSYALLVDPIVGNKRLTKVVLSYLVLHVPINAMILNITIKVFQNMSKPV